MNGPIHVLRMPGSRRLWFDNANGHRHFASPAALNDNEATQLIQQMLDLLPAGLPAEETVRLAVRLILSHTADDDPTIPGEAAPEDDAAVPASPVTGPLSPTGSILTIPPSETAKADSVMTGRHALPDTLGAVTAPDRRDVPGDLRTFHPHTANGSVA
ncbi:hypothetical protein FRACA_10121 [Frankia canadensis]|uniref:Uncharacterized protein n=1 Tax=Frankia canadensis TaxID=1836972 RepID=A0A2I2KI70_9ACTN|nr:hypothetical protein [Frankia canadensis]SNQ45362.1 hypothetical protein FRACA_10121 [Frankia canadensis]SOU52652.1 hypothetical protein FRACA_10121 [Frankia canadensis]